MGSAEPKPEAAPAGTRRAVLIGAATYSEAADLPRLRAPLADVKALSRVLKECAECEFDEVLSFVNPSCQEMRVELNKAFQRSGRDDLLLLYYSGHGKLSPEGRLHLCAQDTLSDLLSSTAFSLTDLKQFIDEHTVNRVIIILDCCFSGAARDAFKGDVPSVLTANLGQGRGKYLLTSSTAIQPSVERAEDDVSLFTKWLVEGLDTHAADKNGDKVITVEEMFLYAKTQVEREHPTQKPQSFAFDSSPGDVIMWQGRQTTGRVSSAALAPLRPNWFASVRSQLARGQIIPFIGAGAYTGGVLNHFALSSALAKRGDLNSQETLASTAEYCERLWKDRGDLVDAFQEILVEQMRDLKVPTTHDLVCEIKPPWLVVSATYDMVLEDRLAKSGAPLVIVSHILRSRDGVYDGKILVLRPGRPAEICPADQFLFDEAKECVIYKVLGSPFLRGRADPGLELDTLVLTETDHLTFLGRLQHEQTKVPQSIDVHFQKRKLLYLGYSLDIWHYRLVLQVFRGAKKQAFAVRQPTSQMEALFWERLGTDMITWDPEEFAKTLLTVEAGTPSDAPS